MFAVQARKKHFFHLIMFSNDDYRQLVRAVQNVRIRCFVQHLGVAVKHGVQEIDFFSGSSATHLGGNSTRASQACSGGSLLTLSKKKQTSCRPSVFSFLTRLQNGRPLARCQAFFKKGQIADAFVGALFVIVTLGRVIFFVCT